MRKYCIIITIGVVGVCSIMWFFRPKQISMPKPAIPAAAPFYMSIDDAFRLKADGRVVVVGVIGKGEISPGMELEIRTTNAVIPVIVMSLEGGLNKPISKARAGDRVGVMLQGANKDNVPAGSQLTARNSIP